MRYPFTLTAVSALALAIAPAFAQSGAQNPQSSPSSQDPTSPSGQQGSRSKKSASEAAQSAAGAMQGEANRLASADSTFAMKAMQGGMAEVELGNLAQEKASSQAVKDFAKRMVEDHSKANDELKTIASAKGITAPSMDSKAQSIHDKLSNMSGAAFDKAYMQDMVSDHQKDVAEFRKEANSGNDPELKAFAAKTLPTLEEHLKLAQQAAQDVKKGGSANQNK